MKNLRYVCAQPRILYYAWQVEVMINNFISKGINPNNIDIVIAYNKEDETSTQENIMAFNKLASYYNAVRFFFYEDTRKKPWNYISSIRPNVLKQHFKAHPELKEDVIFYHDCDIVFSKNPDFSKFLNDNIWYLSDTNSYINHSYITSKGLDIYQKMIDIVGIDPLIPKLMNSNSGGAQYILKNVDETFWEKVENDAEKIYTEISLMNGEKKLNDPSYHELQIWCADMWAVLWNGWYFGHETKVVPELNFTWATDKNEDFYNKTIYHNAGATCGCERQFYKANYINILPYGVENNFSPARASYNYFLEIEKTSKISCLL